MGNHSDAISTAMTTERTKQELIDELTRCRKKLEASNRSRDAYRAEARVLRRHIAEFLSKIGVVADPASRSAEVHSALKVAAERLSKLVRDEKRYSHLIDQANDMIYQTDREGRFILFNTISYELLGYGPEEIMGRHYRDLVHPDYRRKVEKFYGLQFVREKHDSYLEIPLLTKKGGILWIGQHVQLVRENDTVVGFQAIARDITDRKRAEAALRESEEKHRTILEHIEEGYYEVDLSGRITLYNDSLVQMIGYPPDEIPTLNYRRFMDRKTARSVFRTFHSVFKTGMPAKAFDWALIRKDGSRTFVEVSVSLVTDSLDRPVGFRGIARDITDRKQLEEELRRLSITDNLTGLFNQRHFYIKIAEESKRAHRMGYPLCLIIFDLDNFKQYNDTYGHLAGDEVLKLIGVIIKGSVREGTDTGFRYGGDEFAIILPSSTEADARAIASRIRQNVLTRVHGIDISVGIASLWEAESLTALIHMADAAMYGQKGKKKR
jgi:diguanylate cyclase (GGDEF)-like protein/PAS domain S-box-containing protein